MQRVSRDRILRPVRSDFSPRRERNGFPLHSRSPLARTAVVVRGRKRRDSCRCHPPPIIRPAAKITVTCFARFLFVCPIYLCPAPLATLFTMTKEKEKRNRCVACASPVRRRAIPKSPRVSRPHRGTVAAGEPGSIDRIDSALATRARRIDEFDVY